MFLIYRDEGVSKESLDRTCAYFKSHGEIKLVDSAFLINDQKWISCADKLVIPGGADRPYHKKLKGRGCENIKKFVRNGGTYIGICAGAYFGCKRIEFAVGTDLEIKEGRELAFFNGTACGPVLRPYVYSSEAGSTAATVRSCLDGSVFFSYYNGGCTFVADQADENVEVLAEYCDLDNAPVIIKCTYGQGTAILSGIHFETESTSAGIKGNIAEKIKRTAEIKKNFLNEILCL